MSPPVLVVAKAPVPGRVKTRLVPPLTYELAAALHEALLLDTIDACRAEGFPPGVLHATPDEAGVLRTALGTDVPLVLQRGHGLGEALFGAIVARAGEGPTVLVSGDAPGLPPGTLRRAFAELEAGTDVVLGPAADGGFWLIAMRRAHPAPFEGVPWSTPRVLSAVVARCRAAGLTVGLLDPWLDIDTAEDLAAWAAQADGPAAPRTRAFVAEHGDLGAT